MDKKIYEYYLQAGKEGAGDEYTVNDDTRYAFKLGDEDWALFPELKEEAGESVYLLVGESFWQFADTYEDAFDDLDDDDEEGLSSRDTAIATIKLLKKTSSEESIRNLITAVNEAANYNIKYEEI